MASLELVPAARQGTSSAIRRGGGQAEGLWEHGFHAPSLRVEAVGPLWIEVAAMTSSLRNVLLIGLAAVLAGSAAGCGGGDNVQPSTTPSPAASNVSPAPTPAVEPTPAPVPTPTPAPTAPPTAGSPSVPPGFSTTRATGDSQGLGLLAAVRVGAQPGFDRVVFEFEGAVPAYVVQYVPLPRRADPSDLPVALEGDHAIGVRMEPAASYDPSSDPLRLTYLGPTRITTSLSTVLEVVKTGDFEAVLNWAIGVDGKQPFKVTVLQGPPRLVIDVATA